MFGFGDVLIDLFWIGFMHYLDFKFLFKNKLNEILSKKWLKLNKMNI